MTFPAFFWVVGAAAAAAATTTKTNEGISSQEAVFMGFHLEHSACFVFEDEGGEMVSNAATTNSWPLIHTAFVYHVGKKSLLLIQ